MEEVEKLLKNRLDINIHTSLFTYTSEYNAVQYNTISNIIGIIKVDFMA